MSIDKISEPRQDSAQIIKNQKQQNSYMFSFEKESISSILLNGKVSNMILPSKVCISFYTQVFNTSVLQIRDLQSVGQRAEGLMGILRSQLVQES